MTDIEEFTKSIEEMGIETLRRYALSLQERAQLREAHAAAMLREQEQTIERVMKKVIQEERKRFDVVKFFRWMALRIEEYFKMLGV